MIAEPTSLRHAGGSERVAVLGAGLQGVCAGIELARRGVEVHLFDQDGECLNRASLRNEGKIHLGFVYANDSTMASARSMIAGALTFRLLLDRWTNGSFSGVAHSSPFSYLVAEDSLLSPGQLADHYTAVEGHYRERLADDSGLDYLGQRSDTLFASAEPPDAGAGVQARFDTGELAIDLPAMATVLRDAVDTTANLFFHRGHRVETVGRGPSGFRVAGEADGFAWHHDFDQVVNALWSGRLAIDAQMGLIAERGWIHRLKYRILVRLPDSLAERRSATMVLGPYGDVVVHPTGVGYVSWYPECMTGWSGALAPPLSWDPPCRGEVDQQEAGEIADCALAATDVWFPGIAASQRLRIDAGTIFAWGRSDIDDPLSGLHRRDGGGVDSVDGYHSVDTGKLTTAPSFALDVADAVTDSRSAMAG